MAMHSRLWKTPSALFWQQFSHCKSLSISSTGPAWKGQQMVIQTKAADNSTDRQQDTVHKKWFKEEPNKDVGLQEKKKTQLKVFLWNPKKVQIHWSYIFTVRFSVAEHRTTQNATRALEMLQKENLISEYQCRYNCSKIQVWLPQH